MITRRAVWYGCVCLRWLWTLFIGCLHGAQTFAEGDASSSQSYQLHQGRQHASFDICIGGPLYWLSTADATASSTKPPDSSERLWKDVCRGNCGTQMIVEVEIGEFVATKYAPWWLWQLYPKRCHDTSGLVNQHFTLSHFSIDFHSTPASVLAQTTAAALCRIGGKTT